MSPIAPSLKKAPPHNPQNPVAVANYLLQRAKERGESLSILQLVKLVYLAHGWCLGFDRGPLINGTVQAWKHGPVVREVYRNFRSQGSHDIKNFALDADGKPCMPDLTPGQKEVVDTVYNSYIKLHPFTLSEMTHARGTPWAMTPGHYALIDNKVIEDYYKNRVRVSAEKAEQAEQAEQE